MDDTLRRALRLHEAEDLSGAEAGYRQVLHQSPDNVDAICLLGRLLMQRGDHTDAEALMRRAVEQHPHSEEAWSILGDILQLQQRFDAAIATYRKALQVEDVRAIVWNNLGLALQACARYDEAQRCYEGALKRDPELLEAIYNLGLLRYELGDFNSAIHLYRHALRVDPLEIDALNNLGNALLAAGRATEAIPVYQRALQQVPDHAVIRENLKLARAESRGEVAETSPDAEQESDPEYWINVGFALLRRQDRAGAADAYRRALALEPDEPTARHLLNALTGVQAERTPREYIVGLFDNYASRFEGHLVGQLGYQIPALMRWICQQQLGEDMRLDAHLDLGCGTGLVGAEFRDRVDRLIGIDLSQKMLDRCAQKELYDELYLAEFSEWFEARSETFSLITAADVLIYVGELHTLFRHVTEHLKPGGRWLFSTERIQDDVGTYQLLPTGRYAHSRAYIARLAEENGLILEQQGSTELRRNRTGWVAGDVILLQKPGPTPPPDQSSSSQSSSQ